MTKMESEGCCYAGFFDLEGNSWAQSKQPGFTVSQDQVKKIIQGIRSPGSNDLRAGGISLGDKNLLCINVSENAAVFKQKGEGCDKVMVCVGCSNTGAIVGMSHAGEREKASRASVEKYTEYLKSVGY